MGRMMTRGMGLRLGAVLVLAGMMGGCSKPDFDGNRERDAAEGHRPSQIEWGNIYLEGTHEKYPQDFAKAAEWFRKASVELKYTVAKGESRFQINDRFGVPLELIRKANEGVDFYKLKGGEEITIPGARIAQFNLAMLYEQGKGVKQDFPEAVKWHRKAADAGLPEAQFALAWLLETGKAADTLKPLPDFTAAVHWYSRAANQGHGPAQQNLGQMHLKGNGTPQSYVQAYKWFTLAGRTAQNGQMTESTRRRLKRELSAEEFQAREKRDAQLMKIEQDMLGDEGAVAKLTDAMQAANIERAKQLADTFVAKREQ